ncbi:hypothetical protein QJQ45_020801 [Haematococcus lacustris]|nr:hypothetical protein QJQ45_020801 [Haematococcus lacustris]
MPVTPPAKDPLAGHERYEKIQYLSSGSFGFVQFKEVFVTKEYICIAMEYATGGNLFNYVQQAGPLKEETARWFLQQLVIGLDYCHRKGVVNRDIKLENTLLQMVPGLPLPLLKICDFGYSKAHFMSAPKSKVLGHCRHPCTEGVVHTLHGRAGMKWGCCCDATAPPPPLPVPYASSPS